MLSFATSCAAEVVENCLLESVVRKGWKARKRNISLKQLFKYQPKSDTRDDQGNSFMDLSQRHVESGGSKTGESAMRL